MLKVTILEDDFRATAIAIVHEDDDVDRWKVVQLNSIGEISFYICDLSIVSGSPVVRVHGCQEYSVEVEGM